MTLAVETKEEEMGSLPIKPEDPSSYGCQILQEKTTLEAANDKSLPNDCLLYTSPSPRDYAASRMPSSA